MACCFVAASETSSASGVELASQTADAEDRAVEAALQSEPAIGEKRHDGDQSSPTVHASVDAVGVLGDDSPLAELSSATNACAERAAAAANDLAAPFAKSSGATFNDAGSKSPEVAASIIDA